MATTIKLKNGSGAPLAGDLVQGEPALDLTNKRLYTEDSGGTVIEVGTNPTSLTTGTFTSTGIDDNATSTAITIDSSENVGIGTASPSNQLHLNTTSASNVIQLTNSATGTGAGDGMQIVTSSLEMQLRNREAGPTTFYTSNIERMRIDASGNVGIGTSSPASPLHVNVGTNLNFEVENVSSTLRLSALNDARSANIPMQFASSSFQFLAGSVDVNGDFYVGSSNNIIYESGTTFNVRAAVANLTFQTNGANERMRIDSSGDVLIGTSATSYLNSANRQVCHVNGGTDGAVLALTGTAAGSYPGSTGDFYIHSGASGSGNVNIVGRSNGYMNFFTFNTERMRIDSSGNVGIGTTTIPVWNGNAGRKFAVTGPSSNTNAIISLQSGATATDNGAIYEAYSTNTTSGSVALGSIAFLRENTSTTALSSYTAFYTNNAGAVLEKARITSSGNLLVGTTSATVSGAPGFGVLPAGNAAASPFVFSSSDSSADSDVTWAAYSRGVSAYRFYVGYGGTVFATSTSITALSDESLKENIRDLDKGLETINALQPRRFDWKNGDGNDIMGFVAQEVEGVMPELVHEYTYSKEETKLGLKMGDMIPSMVKAIQELSAQVSELKAEVAALKGA